MQNPLISNIRSLCLCHHLFRGCWSSWHRNHVFLCCQVSYVCKAHRTSLYSTQRHPSPRMETLQVCNTLIRIDAQVLPSPAPARHGQDLIRSTAAEPAGVLPSTRGKHASPSPILSWGEAPSRKQSNSRSLLLKVFSGTQSSKSAWQKPNFGTQYRVALYGLKLMQTNVQ